MFPLTNVFFSQVLRKKIFKVNTLNLKVFFKKEVVKGEHFLNCLWIFNQSYLFKMDSSDKYKMLLKFIKRLSLQQ